MHDPGFDFTLLHDFRERLLAHDAPQRFLDTFLTACKARGWLQARGTQRTDATPVLAAIRTLNRLALALETWRAALKQRSEADPQWVRQWVPLEWYQHDGPRAESFRLPTEASQRDALAVQIGADGDARMDALDGREDAPHLRSLPDVEVWRCMWMQQSSHCTEPGMEEVRRRGKAERPPSALHIQSPAELEARYCPKRATEWVR